MLILCFHTVDSANPKSCDLKEFKADLYKANTCFVVAVSSPRTWRREKKKIEEERKGKDKRIKSKLDKELRLVIISFFFLILITS